MKIFSPASVGLFFCEKNLLSFFGVLDTLRYSNGQKKRNHKKTVTSSADKGGVSRSTVFSFRYARSLLLEQTKQWAF